MQITARYPSRFVPLLVEDDPDHAYLIGRAFETASIALPLPILKSGEEAVDYLSGKGAYQDRIRYPLPSVLILDGALPLKSGLDGRTLTGKGSTQPSSPAVPSKVPPDPPPDPVGQPRSRDASAVPRSHREVLIGQASVAVPSDQRDEDQGVTRWVRICA